MFLLILFAIKIATSRMTTGYPSEIYTARRKCRDVQMISFSAHSLKKKGIATPTMCLNEEVTQQKLHFNFLPKNLLPLLQKVDTILRARRRKYTCLNLIRLIIDYLGCGLSYLSIATRFGEDYMTSCRIWNGWVILKILLKAFSGSLSLIAEKR